jgi:hypothetical protein
MMAQTFKSVVDLWPSPDAMAADLGVKVETVRKWRQRDSIPAENWLAIVQIANRNGHRITVNDLAVLAARRLTHPSGEAAA